jgi:hypothetical protein
MKNGITTLMAIAVITVHTANASVRRLGVSRGVARIKDPGVTIE